MSGKIIPERFAIMALDPGGVSGVARGVFSWQGSVRDTLRAYAGSCEAWTLEGESEMQGWEFVAEYWDWRYELMMSGIPATAIYIVIEKFQLRIRNVELSPVEVTSAVKTLLIPRDVGTGLVTETGRVIRVELQEPADAKRYGTAKRLKDWGLYPLGRGGGDHKRDALRHLALKVSKVAGDDL